MASSLCKSAVLKVYIDVIEDVINGVRELFLEEGVDEQVLQELKGLWETKLRATKAVDSQSDIEKQGNKKLNEVALVNGFQKPQTQQVKQVVGQVPPNNHVQTAAVPQIHDKQMVPIQITLPAQPGGESAPRILTIQVPTSALQGNQLSKVLTGPVISATMSLPQPIASSILQQHVNAAFNQPQAPPQQQTQLQAQPAPQQQQVVRQIPNKPVIQSDGAHGPDSSDDEQPGPSTSGVSKGAVAFQFDGPMDTSDEDEDGSDDDEASEDADDDKDEDEQEVDEGGPEEEPLNSEDDVTDEDPTDLFDTENVVVCQYDKITRNRNKWKFHLKDGIMNLNGEDYLFQKASGDAEW